MDACIKVLPGGNVLNMNRMHYTNIMTSSLVLKFAWHRDKDVLVGRALVHHHDRRRRRCRFLSHFNRILQISILSFLKLLLKL